MPKPDRAFIFDLDGTLVDTMPSHFVAWTEIAARHKPEPDVFLEAARRMDADPAVCTVYEDTDIGLEAARRAGMIPFDVRPLAAPRP